MDIETVPLIAAIFVFCVVCQWVAWRIRLPAILFLLVTGIVTGPVLGVVHPDELLGDLLFPFVSLSVAIILFEGSLTLKIREIRGLHIVVRNMLSSGMIVTWFITAIATKMFIHTTWEVATLFGAIMVVTGPTVVAPILRTVRPVPSLANILKWESIVIDPIGASLAVLVFEFIISGGGQNALGHTLITFGVLLVVGAAIGALVGHLFGLCLRYHLIPEFLHNITALGIVFGSFALANTIQPESGLVTVTVFGAWLANMRDVDLEHILTFKETLSILLISLLFIILASRLNFADLQRLGLGAIAICGVIQFLARPLNVMVSTIGSSLKQRERLFLSWIAPRGIVAAAISSLFAIRLQDYGYSDASFIVPLTFTVIIFTVLLQSLTAVPLARILGVSLQKPDGFLIIGANSFARMIAKTLQDNNIKVLIADSSIELIMQARKEKIPTYFGNPMSEHAISHLDLNGIGKLLALSKHESENVAAAFHFRDDFGKKNIFTLQTTPKGGSKFKLRTIPQLRGKTLFGKHISYTTLLQMVESGGIIFQEVLESKFNEYDISRFKSNKLILLFAIDPKGNVHIFNNETQLLPEAGWKVFYLGQKIPEVQIVNYQI